MEKPLNQGGFADARFSGDFGNQPLLGSNRAFGSQPMSAPSPMSRDDLLELAALDAFGLLDDYEAALFTRSFHHAPVGVQDEIRELQAEYAGDEALLPEVGPDATLKARVLRSVATAIEEESIELAPLATIGRRRSTPRDTIATSRRPRWKSPS